MDDLAGYRGKALAFLKGAGARVGDVVEVRTGWGTVAGTVVPRYLSADDSHVVLKLKSGYNVGLDVAKLSEGRVVAPGEAPAFSPPEPKKPGKGLPKVLLLGTGGTIASRIDYRTGAVHPAVDAAGLNALVPELAGIAQVEPEILFNVLSENIEPKHWSLLARRIGKAVGEGYGGVVVTHGTDTLGYTSAALSFALKGVPIPVVITAAQRSSDRPSSDAALNLIGAVSVAALAGFSGVYVAMHQDESDERIAVHGGTRVRKNHTSRRDAFASVGVPLAAVWTRGGLSEVAPGLPRRARGGRFAPKPDFDPRVALVKFYPSMPPSSVKPPRGESARALVIEGTGLGHTSEAVVRSLEKFVRAGGLAFMTTQCMNGRVDLDVYETGRDLLRAGVTPLRDMLSETALVKCMWALANSTSPQGAKELMTENLAGETTDRGFPEM